MKRLRITEEQITYALKQSEAGTPVNEVCRQLGVNTGLSAGALQMLPRREAGPV